MTTFRLLTPDAQYPDDALIERETAGSDVHWSIFRERTPAAIPAEEWSRADALVVWHEMPVDADVIARLDRCQVIVRAGVGFDHIDLEAAAARGIPVCNTPDYGTSEVADHAIAMMLNFKRGLTSYHRELVASPQEGFDHARAPLMGRLRGRTFGIVGLGRIGTATALRAKAFGLNVVCYDPHVSRGTEIAVGVQRVESLEALLKVSDVVSLHCPLTEETRGMINARTLRQMKPGAVVINTARGAIVDVPALLEALRDNVIAGAGLDVLPVEPPSPDDPISLAYAGCSDPLTGERLLLSPHAAWSSPESVADARRLAVETAMLRLRDGTIRNLVNSPEKVLVPATE
ncbi:D-3-phosphoglycerate dehydrogenase/C-terminal binding protein [Pseudooceanicola antarcticus]|uniref:C-terminal binding protein n=1 Tax=Pseudooceanicola antarcticus TaxID=1247613 RepID=A0A285IIG9_9RHOB|nr:C-terminal binding protein [Pseudooceanicola antarcticus]PJE28907.1 C-terminal binding protein [Pseudooceanicola antarcticus]SNY47744.1 D-3-phosphoglycerate dehydrogenase/C-terminal binding protein [Pseudooceanicola antarcticus]